jgi:hypothetical protein
MVIGINDAKMKSTLQLKKGAKSNNIKRGMNDPNNNSGEFFSIAGST